MRSAVERIPHDEHAGKEQGLEGLASLIIQCFVIRIHLSLSLLPLNLYLVDGRNHILRWVRPGGSFTPSSRAKESKRGREVLEDVPVRLNRERPRNLSLLPQLLASEGKD